LLKVINFYDIPNKGKKFNFIYKLISKERIITLSIIVTFYKAFKKLKGIFKKRRFK